MGGGGCFFLLGLLQQDVVTIRQMAAGLTLLGDFVLSLCSIGGDDTLEIQATLPSEYPRKAKVGCYTDSGLSGC